MAVRKFEELLFWQKARALTKLIYAHTKNGDFLRDFGLKDQIQRAAVSIMSNIAEGFGRGGNKEFIQFLFVAKGSLAELQSLLYVALDQDYISRAQFENAYNTADEIFRLITSFIKSMKSGNKKGLKTY